MPRPRGAAPPTSGSAPWPTAATTAAVSPPSARDHPRAPTHPHRRQGQEPERGDGASSGPSAKSSPVRGSRHVTAARQRQTRVEEREPEGEVAEREDGHGERERDAQRARGAGRRDGDGARRAASRAGKTAGLPPSSRRTAPRERPPRPRRDARRQLIPAAGRRGAAAPAQLVGELPRRRAPARGERERAIDDRSSRFGSSGRRSPSGRAPASIARAVSSIEPRQNGCRPASASQSITPTAQTSAAGGRLLAREPLGGDVRERSGHVALLGQRLGLGHPRKAEVEDAHGDPVAVGEQDVRRLDVPVQDAGRDARVQGRRRPARRPRSQSSS